MKRNKGFTYASMVALICVISLFWATFPRSAQAKRPGVNEEAASREIPLEPDWEIGYFPTGYSTITSEIQMQLLAGPVAYHKSHPEEALIIMGAVSEKPFGRDNTSRQMQLAADRALAGRDTLILNGVPRNKIVILKSDMVAIQKGNYKKNQKIMIWHASHPEVSATPLITEAKPCPTQQSCPVPSCPECKDAVPLTPIFNFNIPEQCTKEVKDEMINGTRTITVNVTCPEQVKNDIWCKSHKAACTAIIVGGVVLIGGILAFGCAQGASGPNGSGGDAGVCF